MSPKLSTSSSSSRQTSTVNSRLDKSLAAYMAAASAAGVGMLALAQPAEAKVVYTATNVTLTTPIAIDLNHDGVTDFNLQFAGYQHDLFLDVAPTVTGNAVHGNGSAACGFFGVPVGPGEKFATNSYFGHGVRMANFYGYGVSQSYGPWANNPTNRYLGFKFLINGQVHYGWARLSVSSELRNVVLTGYAYETTPNVTILEGHISGPEKASNVAPSDLLTPANQPATLGTLARGADTLALWRREEQAAN